MDHKIHIAYGFHVNCCHSYRGDTNDAAGFGSDIRIIRGIIRTLDELLAFADGAYATGTDRFLSPYAGDNVWIQSAAKQSGAVKVRSPLLGGVKGNLGKYVVYGARAIAYIVKKQRSAK